MTLQHTSRHQKVLFSNADLMRTAIQYFKQLYVNITAVHIEMVDSESKTVDYCDGVECVEDDLETKLQNYLQRSSNPISNVAHNLIE